MTVLGPAASRLTFKLGSFIKSVLIFETVKVLSLTNRLNLILNGNDRISIYLEFTFSECLHFALCPHIP